MRWPSGMALVLALCAPARADQGVAADRVDRLAAAERTIDLVAARDREHRARLAARVRAFVVRQGHGPARPWLEPGGRTGWLARRAAMGRLLRRDLGELAILRAERDAAVAARDRARAEIAEEPPAAPARGSLVPPLGQARLLARFGVARHRESGAALSGRGVTLAARPGDRVVAVAAGRVRYAGPLAGAGQAVLIDHDGFLSVLVGLRAVTVAPGRAVAAGEPLGEAAGDALHLEIRLRTGAFGHPVDPAPLLGRPPAR